MKRGGDWKQIREGVYERVNIFKEIVDTNKLKQRLREIEKEIDEIERQMLQPTKNTDERWKRIIELYNSELEVEIHALEQEYDMIVETLEEVGEWQ